MDWLFRGTKPRGDVAKRPVSTPAPPLPAAPAKEPVVAPRTSRRQQGSLPEPEPAAGSEGTRWAGSEGTLRAGSEGTRRVGSEHELTAAGSVGAQLSPRASRQHASDARADRDARPVVAAVRVAVSVPKQPFAEPQLREPDAIASPVRSSAPGSAAENRASRSRATIEGTVSPAAGSRPQRGALVAVPAPAVTGKAERASSKLPNEKDLNDCYCTICEKATSRPEGDAAESLACTALDPTGTEGLDTGPLNTAGADSQRMDVDEAGPAAMLNSLPDSSPGLAGAPPGFPESAAKLYDGPVVVDISPNIACDGPCLRTFHVHCLQASGRDAGFVSERAPIGSAAEDADWFCGHCVEGGTMQCFGCNREISGEMLKRPKTGGGAPALRCSLNKCGKVYCRDCLCVDARVVWPSSHRMKCGLHVCAQEGCGLFPTDTQCIRCANGYCIECVPANALHISCEQLVCPKHTDPPKHATSRLPTYHADSLADIARIKAKNDAIEAGLLAEGGSEEQASIIANRMFRSGRSLELMRPGLFDARRALARPGLSLTSLVPPGFSAPPGLSQTLEVGADTGAVDARAMDTEYTGAADTESLPQLRYTRVIIELAHPFDLEPEIDPHNILPTLARRRTVAAALGRLLASMAKVSKDQTALQNFPPPKFKSLDKNGRLFYAFDETGRRRWASQDELPDWIIEDARRAPEKPARAPRPPKPPRYHKLRNNLYRVERPRPLRELGERCVCLPPKKVPAIKGAPAGPSEAEGVSKALSCAEGAPEAPASERAFETPSNAEGGASETPPGDACLSSTEAQESQTPLPDSIGIPDSIGLPDSQTPTSASTGLLCGPCDATDPADALAGLSVVETAPAKVSRWREAGTFRGKTPGAGDDFKGKFKGNFKQPAGSRGSCSGVTVACGEGCINRAVFCECDPRSCPCGDACENRPFSTYAAKRLLGTNFEPFLTADGKGWGLRAVSRIEPGDFVIEYIGEVIDDAECSRRLSRMTEGNADSADDSGDDKGGAKGGVLNAGRVNKRGRRAVEVEEEEESDEDSDSDSGSESADDEISVDSDDDACARATEGHFFIMEIGPDAVIDASRRGNESRFLNHSCDPNCEAQKWSVKNETRIGLFAHKVIVPGEEITFDYHFERFGQPIPCRCGAANCCGFLGLRPNKPAPSAAGTVTAKCGPGAKKGAKGYDRGIAHAEHTKLMAAAWFNRAVRIIAGDESDSEDDAPLGKRHCFEAGAPVLLRRNNKIGRLARR